MIACNTHLTIPIVSLKSFDFTQKEVCFRVSIEEGQVRRVCQKCLKKHVKKQFSFLFYGLPRMFMLYVCNCFLDACVQSLNQEKCTSEIFAKCREIRGQQAWIYSNPVAKIDCRAC